LECCHEEFHNIAATAPEHSSNNRANPIPMARVFRAMFSTAQESNLSYSRLKTIRASGEHMKALLTIALIFAASSLALSGANDSPKVLIPKLVLAYGPYKPLKPTQKSFNTSVEYGYSLPKLGRSVSVWFGKPDTKDRWGIWIESPVVKVSDLFAPSEITKIGEKNNAAGKFSRYYVVGGPLKGSCFKSDADNISSKIRIEKSTKEDCEF
jgi:hypothetical protein